MQIFRTTFVKRSIAILGSFLVAIAVLAALFAFCAWIGKSLTHSQIESPHRYGSSVSTDNRISLTCEPSCEFRELTQVAMNGRITGLTLPLSGINARSANATLNRRSDIAGRFRVAERSALPGDSRRIEIAHLSRGVETGTYGDLAILHAADPRTCPATLLPFGSRPPPTNGGDVMSLVG